MIKAVIFDMDGVIVNNNIYHKKAWYSFCERHQILLEDTIFHKISGRSNQDVLNILFNRNLEVNDIEIFANEKESIYRSLYKEHIKSLSGLVNFLEYIKKQCLRIALASSANKENIDFILDALSLRSYFDPIIDSTNINKGKPDPEIYLKTAETLNFDPNQCVVFEDSISGIESARRAGMKVIGVTTTHAEEELAFTEFVIADFNEALKYYLTYFQSGN